MHAFTAILIALHPILGFIGTFSFPVELPHADQIERVGQQLRLYLKVKLAVTGQAGREVDLDQPGLEI